MPSQPPTDLQTWVQELQRQGQLVEVEAEVDAELEVPEIHRRTIAAGGPALLFKRVKGSPFRLAVNLFGSAQRVESAFGREPREFVAEVARFPEELIPPTAGKLWQKRGLIAKALRVGTKQQRSSGLFDHVLQPAKLSSLPATKSWQRDGGRFLTLPLVYTEHPASGGSNLGMYRVQLFDDKTTGLHFQIGKGGGFHLAAAEALGQVLPVNIHLGGPPALMLAAIAPLPENVPEVLLASLLLGKRLPQTRHRSTPLPIFADAEFALLGEIKPGARRPEGPFGDHYGYYSEIHDYPVFDCHTLLHRKDAIFPATVVGKPRQEDFFLGDFLQELLAPLFPLVMPGVRDLWSYGETGYHSLSAAVVQERYKREAMASAFRILGEGQLSLSKFLLVTDRAIDLHDFKGLLMHILERANFATDLYVFSCLSMDSLDYAGPRINEGSKGVLLGLGEPIRQLPGEFHGTPRNGVREVRVFAPGCLVIEGPAASEQPDFGRIVVSDPAFADWPLLVLTDDAERAAKSAANFLWTTFTRFDPGSDLLAAKLELYHNHPSYTPPILIDARMKPGYPEELFCDDATRDLVERRWSEYFPAGGVEMGDSDRGHLD